MFTGVRRHGAARPAVYSGVHGVSDKSTVRNFRADAPRAVSSDASPTRPLCAVTRASMPAARAAAVNRR